MARRSAAEARTLEASLCGGMPPGTNTTRARSSSVMTCSATIMCPWCTGSKVPPKIPIFKSTSLKVEHRLADPDLVARLRAGPPQGAHHPGLLQLALEALYALPVPPVGLEREPLDTFTRDYVAPVLVLHPHPLPLRPEDPVLPVRHFRGGLLAHLAQHL